jgi:hypothetical protein
MEEAAAKEVFSLTQVALLMKLKHFVSFKSLAYLFNYADKREREYVHEY